MLHTKMVFVCLVLVSVLVSPTQGILSQDENYTLKSFDQLFPSEKIVEIITNKDIFWGYDYIGLIPHLSPNALAIVSSSDDVLVPELIKLLAGEETFAVAHVVLAKKFPSRVANQRTGMADSSRVWKGLRLVVAQNQGYTYDPAQRELLFNFWSDWLKIEKGYELPS